VILFWIIDLILDHCVSDLILDHRGCISHGIDAIAP